MPATVWHQQDMTQYTEAIEKSDRKHVFKCDNHHYIVIDGSALNSLGDIGCPSCAEINDARAEGHRNALNEMNN